MMSTAREHRLARRDNDSAISNKHDDHGQSAYSHRSKSHYGGVLTIMITGGVLSPADSHHCMNIYIHDIMMSHYSQIVQLIPRKITYYESL